MFIQRADTSLNDENLQSLQRFFQRITQVIHALLVTLVFETVEFLMLYNY